MRPAIEERYTFFLDFGFEEAKGLFNLKGGDADLQVWWPSAPPTGVLHSVRNDAEAFQKSLLSNLIRDETREEPEGFFESGKALGRVILSLKRGLFQSRNFFYPLSRRVLYKDFHLLVWGDVEKVPYGRLPVSLRQRDQHYSFRPVFSGTPIFVFFSRNRKRIRDQHRMLMNSIQIRRNDHAFFRIPSAFQEIRMLLRPSVVIWEPEETKKYPELVRDGPDDIFAETWLVVFTAVFGEWKFRISRNGWCCLRSEQTNGFSTRIYRYKIILTEDNAGYESKKYGKSINIFIHWSFQNYGFAISRRKF